VNKWHYCGNHIKQPLKLGLPIFYIDNARSAGEINVQLSCQPLP